MGNDHYNFVYDKYESELRAEQLAFERADLRKAVRCAIVQRCKEEENWRRHRLSRHWYTVKCLLCVCLKRSRKLAQEDSMAYYRKDKVIVAMHEFSKSYGGWDERTIEVGKGVFRNWWYEICTDGDWYM